MIEGQIRAKLGFYERIIARIKMRNVVNDPCGNVGYRDIDVCDNEIAKIREGLFDLYEDIADLMSGGYEDINNMQDDITFMISDLDCYVGNCE